MRRDENLFSKGTEVGYDWSALVIDSCDTRRTLGHTLHAIPHDTPCDVPSTCAYLEYHTQRGFINVMTEMS